jgi:CDP-glycerol glycerophosphotransferase (TagB/SpsB family)
MIAWRHRRDEHDLSFQVGNPLKLTWQMFWRSFRRRLRFQKCKIFYEKPVNGEKYLLYPLQFHPESSTSVAAATYLDEYEVIRNIAFSLPAGVSLYVKDHISSFAIPSSNFYHRLSQLPNVRLISPFELTKQLIRGSIGVITLTSTVGYEALLLNRKVYLYGSVFYQFHPNVIRVVNPAQLFELFKSSLNTQLLAADEYNHDFLAGYYLDTYPGVLNFFLDQKNIEILLDQIYPRLKEVFVERLCETDSVESRS